MTRIKKIETSKSKLEKKLSLFIVLLSCSDSLKSLSEFWFFRKKEKKCFIDYLFAINQLDNIIDNRPHDFSLNLGEFQVSSVSSEGFNNLLIFSGLGSQISKVIELKLISKENFYYLHNLICRYGIECIHSSILYMKREESFTGKKIIYYNSMIIIIHFFIIYQIISNKRGMDNVQIINYRDFYRISKQTTICAKLMRTIDDVVDYVPDLINGQINNRISPNSIVIRLNSFGVSLEKQFEYVMTIKREKFGLKDLPEEVFLKIKGSLSWSKLKKIEIPFKLKLFYYLYFNYAINKPNLYKKK